MAELTSDNLAIDRAVEVADGFDRFDLAERLAGVDLSAHGGQVDEDQVRKRFVGEGREPYDGDPAAGRLGLHADPFVRLAVQNDPATLLLRSFLCSRHTPCAVGRGLDDG